MTLLTVLDGYKILAAHVDQLVYVLQQPQGGTERGKYQCSGNAYATTAVISTYYPSLSRNSVPVSASVDTADASLLNVASLTTGHLTASGLQIYCASTGASLNAGCGGNVTISY